MASIVCMAAMSVPAMLVKKMHQGTCQDQQIRQDAEHVRARCSVNKKYPAMSANPKNTHRPTLPPLPLP